jgi:DNA (cytosine-5)-methyltransferase 1
MRNEILSLFCGAGGLDRGFFQAGFQTVLALDSSSDAVRTFNLNAGSELAIEKNLADLSPQAFLNLIPARSQPIGLIGGPPCQGFSRGNVCASFSDSRNRLPYRFADLLAAANRKYQLHFFVFENVLGLGGPRQSNRLSRIVSRLRDAGFNVFRGELNASDFSIPQRRRRLFLVGLNREIYKGASFEFPIGSGSRRCVADAIRNLPAPKFFVRGLTPDQIPFHPNHWTMMPKSAKFTSGSSSDGRSFRKLNWDGLSPTVAYGNREVHVHPDGGRRLSVLEAMLLQGFPRSYQLAGTLSSQITQVSNAVPPPVAEHLARTIGALIAQNLLFQDRGSRVVAAGSSK